MEKSPEWAKFLSDCRAVWNDLKYFPIPESSDHKTAKVSFVDSWMFERNYGGKRGHEGRYIMASENVRGFYPVISMTDGVVTQKAVWNRGITGLALRRLEEPTFIMRIWIPMQK